MDIESKTTSTIATILNTNETDILEFIKELKQAIENGKVTTAETTQANATNTNVTANVNNLSNQTFNYIINWLKHQHQNESTKSTHIEQNRNNSNEMIDMSCTSSNIMSKSTTTSAAAAAVTTSNGTLNYVDKIRKLENEKHNLVFQVQLLQQQLNITTPISQSSQTTTPTHYQNKSTDEIQFLKSQLKACEKEKEFYFQKFKEYQDENGALKARIQDFDSNSSASFNKFNYIDENDEIDKLRKTIQDLFKLNEEKDKKIDDLNKQVSRFKRIQDIVMQSTQNKHKNLDIDFDNSDSNSIPSINSDKDVRSSDDSRRYNSSSTKQYSSTDYVPTMVMKQHQQHYNQMKGCLAQNYAELTPHSKSLSAKNLNQIEASGMQLLPPSIPAPELPDRSQYNTLPNNGNLCVNSTHTLVDNSSTTLKSKKKNKTSTSQSDLNSGYISDGPLSKYSVHSSRSKNETNKSKTGLKKFFGKLIRTNSDNLRDDPQVDTYSNLNATKITTSAMSEFKRGGFRATAGARLNYEDRIRTVAPQTDSSLFANWPTDKLCDWLEEIQFEMYIPECKAWCKSGLQLLQASQNDYEKHLNMKNSLHRKRLGLYLQAMCNGDQYECVNFKLIDVYWVTKWLDDIGLPQYKEYFQESKIDGLMLYNLTNEDLINLNVHSELHHLSIKRAIQVLRMHNFNPTCLKRRPSSDDKSDKADVAQWTNHRVMEWLRSVDLSEYAPNLRGSGVHGGLMVFEPRFNSTVLADILSIPISKTLLRRHLNTHFIDLIGSENQLIKREAELKPNYQALSAANKIKLIKNKAGGLFGSHKRTKSTDAQQDYLCSPVEALNVTTLKQGRY